MKKLPLFALLLLLPLAARADKPDYNDDIKVTKLLKTSKDVVGKPFAYPKDAPAEASMLIVEFPPGKQTGWHKHPSPIFVYVLEGTLKVYFADGTKKTMTKGDAISEAVNVLHNGVNETKEPVKLLVFVAGEKDVPFTVKAPVDKDGRPLGDFEHKVPYQF